MDDSSEEGNSPSRAGVKRACETKTTIQDNVSPLQKTNEKKCKLHNFHQNETTPKENVVILPIESSANTAGVLYVKSSAAANRPLIDVDELESQWKMKSDRISGCSLRGGDQIFNDDRQSVTLSFIFEYDGHFYGLTVGHIAPSVGKRIWCLASVGDESRELTSNDTLKEIGCVVSYSEETNSLVFRIHDSRSDVVQRMDCLKLHEKLGLEEPITLPEISEQPLLRPEVDDILVGFGGQRRGAVGKVVEPSESQNGTHSREGNISMVTRKNYVDENTVTDGGDCGTIFLGLGGEPLYMHHCIDDPNSTANPKSYGFPLAQVMAAHKELGGTPQQNRQLRRSPITSNMPRQIRGTQAHPDIKYMIDKDNHRTRAQVRRMAKAPDGIKMIDKDGNPYQSESS